MSTIDDLFQEDPLKWIRDLPSYQRESIEELLARGSTLEDVARSWLTASAENTYRFSASTPVGDKGAFLASLKKEVRKFLCGDKAYKNERDRLFGEKGLARTYVVSAMSVAIAPYLSVSAVVISPLIALVIASIGKITIHAWCATQDTVDP